MDVWLTIRTFIAFFFLLFGTFIMAGVPDERWILGAFFAALGLTFFWRLWVADAYRQIVRPSWRSLSRSF